MSELSEFKRVEHAPLVERSERQRREILSLSERALAAESALHAQAAHLQPVALLAEAYDLAEYHCGDNGRTDDLPPGQKMWGDCVKLGRAIRAALSAAPAPGLVLTADDERAVTFEDRLVVGGLADSLPEPVADALIDAVRCCGEFPECSHVLAWVEEYDAGKIDPALVERMKRADGAALALLARTSETP